MIMNDHTRKILSVHLSGQGLLAAGLGKAFYQPTWEQALQRSEPTCLQSLNANIAHPWESE